MARPSKYKPEYCEQVIELMSEGCSIEEVAFELKIRKQTLYNWTEQYPEFLDAIEIGRELSLGWWMKEGRNGIKEKVFQTGLYVIQMANRFGWSSKTEQKLSTDKEDPIQVVIGGANIKLSD